MQAFANQAQGEKSWDNKLKIIICAVLAIITFSVYQQVTTHHFINFDDEMYITQNPRIADGLTLDNIGWAFRTIYFSNWHPLTWLSYFLDAQLFGVNAPAFLLVNVFIHIANTLLLFLFFNRTTKCLWRSAFLASLFALHPLHVESVAWASERKDVLCAFFGILTMGAYFSYAEAPSLSRYLRMLICFVLGLMAKPMLITLPFLLLLLDYWPLKRMNVSGLPQWIAKAFIPPEKQTSESPIAFQKSPVALIKEKIPLFSIMAASACITVIAQQSRGAMAPLEMIPIGFRAVNALVSYYTYLVRMFWPHPLSVFYPFPTEIPWWQIVTAGATLVIVSCLTLKYASRRPYMLVGWLWYLGSLVPVIGLLQVGKQAMADRYTYIPLIGLFLMLVWLASDMAASKPPHKRVLCLLATVSLLVLVTLSVRQIGYWKDSYSLFKNTLETTSESATAHISFGTALARRGKLIEAAAHFKSAIRLEPYWAQPYNNLGLVISQQGRLDAALLCFQQALRLEPEDPIVIKNYERNKRFLDEKLAVIATLELQAQREPRNVELQTRIGMSYQEIFRFEKALIHFHNALAIDAGNVVARNALGTTYASSGKYQEAEKQFKCAIETDPESFEAYYLLAGLYGRQNTPELTLDWLSKAINMGFNNWNYLKADPNFASLRGRPDFEKLIGPSTQKG